MSDPVYSPMDYIAAHDVVRSIGQDMQIHFQMTCETMSREEAVKHFTDRQAIIRVQKLLIEAGEKAAGI